MHGAGAWAEPERLEVGFRAIIRQRLRPSDGREVPPLHCRLIAQDAGSEALRPFVASWHRAVVDQQRLPTVRGQFETVVRKGGKIGPAIGRAVIGVTRADHDLGKICTVG